MCLLTSAYHSGDSVVVVVVDTVFVVYYALKSSRSLRTLFHSAVI